MGRMIRGVVPPPPPERRTPRGVLLMVMIFSASSWWSAASHAFPATDAVGSFYNLMIAQRSVASAWAVGGLGPLLLVSAAYLLAGIGAFILGERVAKRRGTLARY